MVQVIWLMGPSGSGKDTVLTGLRARHRPDLVVAHRYITRQAHAGGENHVALSPVEFDLRRRHGLFSLHWQAHGHRYGVGQELDLWLKAGLHVVVNGSRQHLESARARYGSQLLPICLAVSGPVLRQRLEQRGRESPQDIARRLERARAYTTAAGSCYILNNDGDVEQAVHGLLTLITRADNPTTFMLQER